MRKLLVTTALVAWMPLPVFAQTVPSQGAAPSEAHTSDSANTADQLSEIVVTAQRRAESLQRAAVAVNVVQGSDLIKSGIVEPSRLGELSPGLAIQPAGAIFIRGVGNFTLTPNSDPATAFNYDGVYVGRPTSINGLFFDLDRIEILKGPQGTLYGRNATGGAINVLPTQPKAGEFSGYLSGDYGNYKTFKLQGAVNAPLGDDGALRVSGNFVQHDGYLDDGTYDDREQSLRVQLKANLTPDLTVRVSADYNHLGGEGGGATYLGNITFNAATRTNVFTPPGVSLAAGEYTAESQAFRTTVTAGTAGRPFDVLPRSLNQNNRFYGSNAQIDWRTGAGTLTIVPAWRYADLNNIVAPGFLLSTAEKDEQYSLEARFTGNRIGIFDYIVGGYYFDEDIRSRQVVDVSFLGSFLNNHYTTKSFAPFGRLTAHLSDRLRLVGGLRYSKDRKHFTGITTGLIIACTAPRCLTQPLIPLVSDISQIPFAIPAQGGPPALGRANGIPTGAVIVRTDRNDDTGLVNDKITYHAGVEFDAGPQSLVYAHVETGYRSGGFSPATGFETYQPETITAYTVGSKNRFAGGRLQLNLEAFWWEYRNQQLSHVGVDLSGRAANLTQNIGRSRNRGFEVEGRALVTPTTLLSINFQYLDAKYKSFVYQQLASSNGAPPLNNCANTTVGTLVTVDCSGKPAFNAPKYTINLAGQQTVKLGDYRLVGSAQSQFLSARFVGFEYLDQERVSSSWRTNIELLFGPDNDRWSIAGFVQNVEGNRVVNSATLVPLTGLLSVTTTTPRVYGVRAAVKF
ncbi:MAG: TonB-dependent receptor [Bradyrhizobium sp.]|nr:TonB-dependent receptor [Bradyrhizobium sp.]